VEVDALYHLNPVPTLSLSKCPIVPFSNMNSMQVLDEVLFAAARKVNHITSILLVGAKQLVETNQAFSGNYN
jgi:hypothetical protein